MNLTRSILAQAQLRFSALPVSVLAPKGSSTRPPGFYRAGRGDLSTSSASDACCQASVSSSRHSEQNSPLPSQYQRQIDGVPPVGYQGAAPEAACERVRSTAPYCRIRLSHCAAQCIGSRRTMRHSSSIHGIPSQIVLTSRLGHRTGDKDQKEQHRQKK